MLHYTWQVFTINSVLTMIPFSLQLRIASRCNWLLVIHFTVAFWNHLKKPHNLSPDANENLTKIRIISQQYKHTVNMLVWPFLSQFSLIFLIIYLIVWNVKIYLIVWNAV